MPISIFSAHNFYQQPGGEDVVFASEADLLRRNGHEVVTYERDNREIHHAAATALSAIWSMSSHRDVRTLLQSGRASIAHFHNTLPLISPSAYYAAHRQGAAVVQTLHNYRLICPGGMLARDGLPCEKCVDQGSFAPSLQNGCYRGSRAATAGVVAMTLSHKALGTYQSHVDAYIAISEYSREKFIQGGLPAERIYVKPNFVSDDPAPGKGDGDFALFVGRLVPEKGLHTLVDAWKELCNIRLDLVGDGPLSGTSWPRGITFLKSLPHAEVLDRMKSATVLIVPSTSPETGPQTVLEAFACGTPVIASNLGSLAERVRHAHNGLLFRAGDAADLASQVRYAFAHPEHMAVMRRNARREYEAKYTAQDNYNQLMDIYAKAIEHRHRIKAPARSAATGAL